MEEWRTIEEFENYEVSNLGRVRNIDYRHSGQPKLMSISLGKRGYKMVNLYKNGGHYVSVHRLVAKAFIPNPDNLPEVDHINRVRDDCRVENLRWVTREENMKNCVYAGNRRRGYKWTTEQKEMLSMILQKPVVQYDIHRRPIRIWNSATDAERVGGYNASAINKCCKGKAKTSYGFFWSYYQESIL